MKTKFHCFLTALALLALSILNAQLSTCFAQGTAFTYQGRLNDGTNPANGNYDFQFYLRDAASGGNPVGTTNTPAAVGVTNGLFIVTLDFGNQFPGVDRWLEIGVRTNGVASFVTLVPRQKLTPTPYAIFANTASNVSGTISTANLSGTYGNPVTFNNAGNSFTGNGSGLAGVNAASLNGLGAGNFWQTTGNAGTTPGLNYVGTTDNQPLELHVNAARALRLEPNTNGAPNIIGGSSLNYVSNGVFGATIAGGGAANYSGSAYSNGVAGVFGTVGGGIQNAARNMYATVSGGAVNTASGLGSFIGGGADNLASSAAATIGGGQNNTNTGVGATVAGGSLNTATGFGAFIGGGGYDGGTFGGNLASGNVSAIGGGMANMATNSCATVGGGSNNVSGGFASTVAGGYQNTAVGDYSTTAGGHFDNAGGLEAVVGGGYANNANAPDATISGGYFNSAAFVAATVGGGEYNNANGLFGTIGGGNGNHLGGTFFGAATVGGGYVNHADIDLATVGGGYGNNASGYGAFIGGGGYDGGTFGGNLASGNASTVAGGLSNQATNNYATVAGGNGNNAGGLWATVGGGQGNNATTRYTTVSGGQNNTASDYYTTVGGGLGNNATIVGATVSGGENNTAGAAGATVPGGNGNTAKAGDSFAAGDNSLAQDPNSFVWGDGSRQSVSQGADTFSVLSTGGFWIFSGAYPAGVKLPANASAWVSISDRNAKKNIQPVDYRVVLDKLAKVPVEQWNYKWEKDSDTPNIGPMAQDFIAAFYPGRDDKGISTLQFDGVELAAIQGLNQKLNEKDARINALEKELSELKQAVEKLSNRKD